MRFFAEPERRAVQEVRSRRNGAATLLANGQVLVVGGEDAQGNHIASAELNNPATGTRTVTGSLAAPRIDHSATLLSNGDVLVPEESAALTPQAPRYIARRQVDGPAQEP